MARTPIEECPRIDAFDLVRHEGFLSSLDGSGDPREANVVCRDLCAREAVAIRCYASTGAVELTHLHGLIPGKGVRCMVPMELFPGSIAFFRCPGAGCGRRVRHLYLHEGELRCRHCHSLVYTSERWGWPPWDLEDAQSPVDGEEGSGEPADDAWQETIRQLRREEQETERERRRRYVQHTGRPGRPKERRHYRHDDSRKVKLGPGEAYCCRCRAARPCRYPRRAELLKFSSETDEELDLRVAIRARCRVCNTPVFRIVRPEEAEGLQDFYG
jgi:hypothetical protein